MIPPMLAPNLPDGNGKPGDIPKKTPARLEKLFHKLDLSGMADWSPVERESMKKVFEDYHHLFVLEDLELGRTDLVQHVIKLDDPKPFLGKISTDSPHISMRKSRNI